MTNCKLCGQEIIQGDFEGDIDICTDCIIIGSKNPPFERKSRNLQKPVKASFLRKQESIKKQEFIDSHFRGNDTKK